MKGVFHRRSSQTRSVTRWLPAYAAVRGRNLWPPPVKRIWVTFADHFEPWWRQADEHTARARTRHWLDRWPRVAERHADSAGRPPCYTFFYPEEQYDDEVLSDLARLQSAGLGDVEVHLHHDNDVADHFVERVSTFVRRLHERHGLLRRQEGRLQFGFIHGNWALDNSLPGGRFCGLNNEISLLRDLGCYADFTLPAAPSRAQTRMVNTIYWATDNPELPKSHDRGTPVRVGHATTGDLLLIPGPLTFNLREWAMRGVPRLECGELAGNCLATRHRARLWIRVAPRLGDDVFIKLFAHGAPEKNALPLLEDDGVLDRAMTYLREEAGRLGAQVYFVSAWQMYQSVLAVQRGANPLVVIQAPATPTPLAVGAP